MTMTDPIADMLTRVRNGNKAYHDSVRDALQQDQDPYRGDPPAGGLHRGWSSEGEGVERALLIDLKYGQNRERTIAGIRRISKPGLRVYAKANNLPKVLGGLGVAIISTSTGLLTDKQAAKRGVGGEVLAYVW